MLESIEKHDSKRMKMGFVCGQRCSLMNVIRAELLSKYAEIIGRRILLSEKLRVCCASKRRGFMAKGSMFSRVCVPYYYNKGVWGAEKKDGARRCLW